MNLSGAELTEIDIGKLQVAKVKCLKELLFHTRYFFKKQYNKKFIVNEHHIIICEALERVLEGKCKRLIINLAPRYSKTELAVKNFIPHGLALNPKAKFIHLSYGDDIALDNSLFVKDTIQSEAYQQLFPDVQIKKNATALDRWYTTEGGGVLARAAGGQVTGFGAGAVDLEDVFDEFMSGDSNGKLEGLDAKFQFNGAIIIDDPIKPEEADQDTVRVKVNNRFDSTIRNRVNSRNTPIIVIMQRLHEMDLTGYLLRDEEADEWEVISLPAIKENGEALWPFKHTKEELLKLKTANELVFERQYMQNPKPKVGLMFPSSELNYFDIKEILNWKDDADFIYLPVDPANLGGDDFAAIVCRLHDKKIYVTDVLYNTEGADINEDAVVAMAIKEKAHGLGIEGVFGWKETAVRIREALAIKNFIGEVRVLRPRTAKHVRISSRSSFIKNYFVFREDYDKLPQYAKFMRNLTSYKKIQEPGALNKHDEAPDVCEMGAAYFEKNFPDLWM